MENASLFEKNKNGSNNWNWKEICWIGSEIIATRTAGAGRRKYFDFTRSADKVEQG